MLPCIYEQLRTARSVLELARDAEWNKRSDMLVEVKSEKTKLTVKSWRSSEKKNLAGEASNLKKEKGWHDWAADP
jgi:hypothetical protein